MIDTAAFRMVRKELDTAMGLVEVGIRNFVEEGMASKHREECLGWMEQVRGAFEVVGLLGAHMLSDEMLALFKEGFGPLPENVSSLNEKDFERKLSALSDGILTLKRYVEHVQTKNLDIPELLLPYINEIRFVREQPLISESYFYQHNIQSLLEKLNAQDKVVTPANLNDQTQKRVQLMFQVALLGVLKEKDLNKNITLLSRACMYLVQASRTYNMQQMWKAAYVMFYSMANESLNLTIGRKVIFSQLERQMKFVFKNVDGPYDTPKHLLSDLVYLMLLSNSSDKHVKEVCEALDFPNLAWNEKDLLAEKDQMAGPSVSVMETVATATREELQRIKELLDLAARGTGNSELDYEEIISSLQSMSNTLSMLSLQTSGKLLDKQVEEITAWIEEGGIEDSNRLLAVADAVLYVESTVGALDQTITVPPLANESVVTTAEQAAQLQLMKAKEDVLTEAQSNLVIVKNAITEYVEANNDQNHLSEVSDVMSSVCGSLIFVSMEREAAVVKSCSKFINEKMLNRNDVANDDIENLAKTISCIEIYFENVLNYQQLDPALLDEAESSLAKSGY